MQEKFVSGERAGQRGNARARIRKRSRIVSIREDGWWFDDVAQRKVEA